jgi:Flp pilus assembly pilin Flp
VSKIFQSRFQAQGFVEYGLVVAVVALVVMVGANSLSGAEKAYFGSIGPSLAPVAPTYTPIGAPTVVTVTPVTGTYGGTVTLTATLTRASDGSGVPNKTLSFMLNGIAVCGGASCPTTNGNGTATLNNVSLVGIHAGTYTTGILASFQGDANYGISTGTGTLIVNQAPQSIAFAQPASPAAYLSSFTVAPTASSGLQTIIAASGGCTAVQSYSSYTITMTSSSMACVLTATQPGNIDYSAAPPASRTVAASKAQATVTITNISQTYTGSPRPVTVTTSPEGLAYSVTYSGGATPPTNAGSYAVSVTINDSNYQGTASATLVISQAPATVTLSNLTAIYSGTAHAVTATTNPAGLSTTFTYSSPTYPVTTTPPTNAGTYSVSATVTDPNYTGSKTGTLTVTPATTNVLVDAKTVTSQNKTSVTLTASVYASGVTPVPLVNQGTLTFSVSGPTGNPCANPLSPVNITTGSASITCNITNPVATGNTFTIVGTYSAGTGGNFATSNGSAAMTAVANGAKSTNLTVSPAHDSTSGGPVTLLAILTDISNKGISGKSIVFDINGSAVCGGGTGTSCPTTDSTGVASLTVNLGAMPSNTYPIGANWAGDSNALASNGSATLTVN